MLISLRLAFLQPQKVISDSVKEIAQTIKNSSVTGLARCTQKDMDIAWEALKDGAEPRLHIFLATSPIHREYKLKMSKEQVVETSVAAVKYAAAKISCRSMVC